jgi:hypothetical protein
MRLALVFLLGLSTPAFVLGWLVIALCLRRFGDLYVFARWSDAPPPRRLVVLTFCLLHGLSELGRRIASWADRRAGTHRVFWNCCLGIGRHVPGRSMPRSPAEAAEDLIATTKVQPPQ